MDNLEIKVSVMVLGELIKTGRFDEDDVGGVVFDAVRYARLLIKELNEPPLNTN